MADQVIDYDSLAQDALRGVVRAVLRRVGREGAIGDHHFYVAFDTQANGVSLSKRLREQYPEEMTIVLQHRFWDLKVEDDRFEVKLTFDSIPETLGVPYSAIKVFFDPSVPYGLQFEASGTSAHQARNAPRIVDFVGGAEDDGAAGPTLVASSGQETSAVEPGETPGPPGASYGKADDGDEGASSTAEIVELDSFRKK